MQLKFSSIGSVLLRYRYLFFSGCVLVVAFFSLRIDIMEVDAAQYATIASEMAASGSYLKVYSRGLDYLDKPPLLFWMSSVTIALLGHTSVAYKLFPVMLMLIGIWATYRFARVYYNKQTGVYAALIFATTQAFHLMTNDIRTDGLLTAFVMLSVWLLSEFIERGKLKYLILGGVCIGAAMLSKGPIGIVIPAFSIGGHLVITGQWKKIFNPVWLLLIPVMALILAPMCYGLYQQFDLHPEKDVYGMQGPSGLKFFFWTQSFGRITGENYWANNTPWYFFVQTMLWDLQPWMLLFVPSFFIRLKKLFNPASIRKAVPEWISFSGFVLVFFALSLSRYKLPHYIFPLFPFAAVMLADFLVRRAQQLPKWLEYIQLTIIHLLLLASLLVMFWAFPIPSIWLPVVWVIGYAGVWWWRKKATNPVDRWILPSMMGIVLVQLVLSAHFYPSLLAYQGGSQAGKFIKESNPQKVYWYDKYAYAMHYYADRSIPYVHAPGQDAMSSGSWIYVSEENLQALPPHRIIKKFDDFAVTRLSLKFINPKTRAEKLQRKYLVEIE
jgi:4-amino-4-deoxy-L-arabinose transferase-like glycosyltransferase